MTTIIFLLCFCSILIGFVVYLLYKNNQQKEAHQKLHEEFNVLESKINAIELDELRDH